LFENNDPHWQLVAIFGKTRCLKQQGLYDQAMGFLENWQAYSFPDSSLSEIHYQQVLCTYLGGHFENKKRDQHRETGYRNRGDQHSHTDPAQEHDAFLRWQDIRRTHFSHTVNLV